MTKFLAKLPYIVKVGWGLVALFAFLGIITGRANIAVPMACIVAVMWVMLRIVYEAIISAAILFISASMEVPKDPQDKP